MAKLAFCAAVLSKIEGGCATSLSLSSPFETMRLQLSPEFERISPQIPYSVCEQLEKIP